VSAIYNEIEPFAVDWLRNLISAGHIATGEVNDRSIADLTASDVAGPGQRHFFAGIGGWSLALRLAGIGDDAHIWTGSCPCQPFSAAGKQAGTSDARHLWPAWFALIKECRPAIIFGEQVASDAGLEWLDCVFSDLEGQGYAVGAADLSAAGLGAPHIRQRLYFVAHASGARLQGADWSRRRVDLQSTASDLRRQWETEPALDRLANGLRGGGVGRLRGYGNAIVPQVAATFVAASLDAIGGVQ
jgi:DNA (cytosine-5)-methyltransferase 1